MANAGWRLTEDEVIAEASKDNTYCQLSVDVGMWASKTQAKRIMDKMEIELRKFTCVTGKEIADSPWWQDLRKKALGE